MRQAGIFVAAWYGQRPHLPLRYVAPWRSGAPSGSPDTRPCGQLLRFDGSAPHPGRSRNVIGSRMAGARRAADMHGFGRLIRLAVRRADLGYLSSRDRAAAPIIAKYTG